jgi:hypothetical protein
MLVVTDAAEFYQSFWVNKSSDQAGIFLDFCKSVAAYTDATLFHFGNYEVRAIKELKRWIGDEHSHLVDRILGSSYNVLPVLYHHCYFPTYSNRLKDVAS